MFFVALLFANGGAQANDLFPIRISSDHRTLEDAKGKPFLLQGDTAWSLIAELNREDVDLYLIDRKKRGFNAVLVNLIEHQFSSNPPANIYGDKPFTGDAFGEINGAYFDHAEWVVKRAQELGIVVFLTPAYLGVNGNAEGWFMEAQAAGPQKMRLYGEAVAKRFSRYDNVVWVMGGDFDAPDRSLVSELADGIAAISPNAIQTVHSGRDTNTFELWADQRWLNLDTVYTYDDVHAVVSKRSENARMPVILLESAYEFERETTAHMIRRNAYGAVLAGAAGQFYGNNPIWHFTGPGVFTADRSWKEALDSPGARSMSVLRSLFDRLPWQQLQPDREGRIISNSQTYAASLPDSSLIVIYGDAGGFDLNRAALSDNASALWFDPMSGKFTPAQSPVPSDDLMTYQSPPDRIASARSDWVLLIGQSHLLETIQKH